MTTFVSESCINTGLMFPSGETSGEFLEVKSVRDSDFAMTIQLPLMFSQADSPVNLFPKPGSEKARQMTVTSGLKCLDLYGNFVLELSFLKTLLASSRWHSEKYWLTWKAKPIPSSRLWLFQLVPSLPPIFETEFGLWPAPTNSDDMNRKVSGNPVMTKNGTMRHANAEGEQSFMRLSQVVKLWPTPTMTDHKRAYSGAGYGMHLPEAVKNWSTPNARDFKGRTGKTFGQTNLPDQVDGYLNPAWDEQMMGFPAGWTELGDSPPIPDKPKKRGKRPVPSRTE